MDRMADIRIVASTSLIEINSSNILSGSNAIVYLSSTSANERGTFVTIRDVGGLCSNDRPIIVSTTKDISFFEGGIQSSFTIVEPYQFYLLSIHSSNLWSVVNTFSFPTIPQVFGTISTVSTGIFSVSSPVTMVAGSQVSTKFLTVNSISSFTTAVKTHTLSSLSINCNSPSGILDVEGAIRTTSTFINKVGIYTSTSSYSFDCLSSASVLQSTNQVIMLATLGNQVQFNLASDPLVWSSCIFDQPINIHSIGYDGYRFIGVGTGGGYNMSFSQDGINWSNSTSAPFSNCYGIKYNGRQWLLLGEGTTTGIVYSSDGTTWNSTVNSMKIAKDAIYDGRKWLAVGNPSTIQSTKTIQYSLDGITWSNITSGGFYSEGRGIGFNGSYYVATGKGSGSNIEESIQRSFDGINWSNTEGSLFDKTQGGNKVTFHFPYWVVAGFCDISGAGVNGTILHSVSGTDWVPTFQGGFAFYATDIIWNGSYWVATGKTSYPFGILQFSSNVGIEQERQPPINFVDMTAIEGDIAYGVFNTTPVTPNLKNNCLQINTQNIENYNLSTNELFVNDYFTYLNKSLLVQKIPTGGSIANGFVGINAGYTNVSIIDSNYEFSSYRPIRTTTLLTNHLDINSVGGSYNLNYSSTSSRITSFYTNCMEVSTTMNVQNTIDPVYLAVGQNILRSSNGFDWVNIDSSFPSGSIGQINCVASNGSIWLIGGYPSFGMYYSSNASNWVSVSSFTGSKVNVLAWNGTYWLAGGELSGQPDTGIRLRKSFDGINWTDMLSNVPFVPCALKWGDNKWVMGSSNWIPNQTNFLSSILISADDAVTWVTPSNTFGNFGSATKAIEYNGSFWLAVGKDGPSVGKLSISSNAYIWSTVVTSFFNTFAPTTSDGGGGTDIKWNGSMFVATGYANPFSTIKYSYDGLNWSTSVGSFCNNANSVWWDKTKWLAVGQNNSTLNTVTYSTIKYSYDGISWSNISGGFEMFGNSILGPSYTNFDLQFNNLSFFSKNEIVPQTFNVIYSYNSTISLNRVITVQNNKVGINVSTPISILDILPNNIRMEIPFASTLVYTGFPIVNYNDSTYSSLTSSFHVSSMLSTIGDNCATLLVPQHTPTSLQGNAYFYSRYNSINYAFYVTGNNFFTGQHASIPSSNIDLLENIGKIVSADKGYTSYTNKGKKTGKDAIWITEALPNIKLTSTDKDPTVFGVITNYANDAEYADNENPFGDKLAGRIRVNGLGEGAIWVTNINGNLENGDYICSSEISGLGRKQDDDKLHSYTVAKITMSCDFELNQDEYVCEELEWNGSTLRKAFVGCTYHCS